MGTTLYFHQIICDIPKLPMVHSVNKYTEFIMENFILSKFQSFTIHGKM